MNLLSRASLAVACLLSPGPSFSGVVAHAGIPNAADGTTLGCRNPLRILGIVRKENSTVVFQARPTGIHWQAALPAMGYDYDQYYLAPDGSAAVVAISPGLAYLVAGRREPIEIDGAVLAVDFQKNLALVATADPRTDETAAATASETSSVTRVRVYELASGAVVGDSRFADALAFEVTHDADKRFVIRLSADGRYYHYIRWTRDRGDELVVRAVSTGRLHASYDTDSHPGTLIDGARHVTGIHDAMLYAGGRGYMVSGGGLFRIDGARFAAVEITPAIGWAAELIESPDGALQAVVGRNGWGIFDTARGRWLMDERVPYHMNLQWDDAGLVVIDASLAAAAVRVYDVSGSQLRLIRSVADERLSQNQSLACINAYGFLTYQRGQYVWVPTAAQP